MVRRTLVLRAAESLATQPDDSLSLNHWRTGYFATYALCEALALFGLVSALSGLNLQQSAAVLRRRLRAALLLPAAGARQRLIFLTPRYHNS